MITLYEDDTLTVKAEQHDSRPGEAFMHCEVKDWNVNQYKRMLDIWVACLNELSRAGCRRVNSVIPKKDRKARKFQTMFGLSPTFETEDYVQYSMEV